MPDRPTRHVFVSYSSKDRKKSADLVEQVFTSLRGLRHSSEYGLELFIDDERLRAGDHWDEAIERALEAADLGLLLLSPNFLDSDYVMRKEAPRLYERSRSGSVQLVPVLLHTCPYETIPWLKAQHIRPRDKQALSDLEAAGRTELDRALTELTKEIHGFLVGRPVAGVGTTRDAVAPAVARPSSGMDADAAASTNPSVILLATTLLHDLGDAEAQSLAQRLVAGIAQLTRTTGDSLFRAVRFCIEFQLLMADDPASPASLQHFLGAPVDDEAARRLLRELRDRAPSGDFARAPIKVNSYFFSLTREREELWKRYFDAVLAARVDDFDREKLASLCPVQVQYGFLAPQHLVAGLLSRFNDDWRPVLNAYQNAVPDPRVRRGAFESLQASQWNCWLVWGPSIPICSCPQWRGAYAFQYGYGDENNSLPVVDLSGDGGRPLLLDPVTAAFDAEGRGAKWVQLTGRLRWGPWYLREAGDGDGGGSPDDHFDLAAADEIDAVPVSSRHPAAPAQAALYRDDGVVFRHDSDGITLQVDTVDRMSNDHRVYFSAYLWTMFLVASSSDEPGIGPKLLRGKGYPRWPDPPERRDQVREARLWEHLLPVFVHANVADPAALGFQKRVLAQNAIALLQQVWQRRAELFDERDVQAGIRFHLASASDFSGCGCPVRYPSGTSLVSLLRERLELEPDREFAAAVMLPASTAADPARPRGLVGYFSSCHLPELVADYFDSVKPRK
jgi:hypothetical protein